MIIILKHIVIWNTFILNLGLEKIIKQEVSLKKEFSLLGKAMCVVAVINVE